MIYSKPPKKPCLAILLVSEKKVLYAWDGQKHTLLCQLSGDYVHWYPDYPSPDSADYIIHYIDHDGMDAMVSVISRLVGDS